MNLTSMGMTYAQKERTIQAIRWIIKGRWIILVGAGSLGVVQKWIGASSVNLSPLAIGIILAFSVLLNFFYWFNIRRGVEISDTGLRVISLMQILVDQIIYSFVVYFTGGIESLSFVFYILPILSATVLYQTLGIMIFALMNVLLYIGLIYGELVGVLAHQSRYLFDPGIFRNPEVTISNALLVIATIVLASIFTTFISRMLRGREMEITRERDKVMSMLKRFPDGVIMLDEELRISFFNERAKEMFQMQHWDSIVGRKLTSQIIPKNFSDIVPALRQKSKVKDAESIEVGMGTGPDRSIFQVSTTPLTDASRQTIGMMKVIHDVTREREIDRMKSEFISIAAHQLRTPLSAVKWVLKMIMDGDMGKITPEQKKYLGKGYESNERMINLVNDLLSVSRIEEGRFLYEFEMVDLDELIKAEASEENHAFTKKNLTFEYHRPSKGTPKVYADPTKLRLVVQNLLDNAVRYTPAEGKITIDVSRQKDFLSVSVSDTGVGIPKTQQRKLFTKFFRASNVLKMSPDGTGLGLFIVRNIVRKHGGQIDVKSEEGKGATFTFTIPLKKGLTNVNEDEDFKKFMQSF